MAITADILTTLIKNQRSAIRYLTVFTFSIIVVGSSLIVFSFVFLDESDKSDTLKLFMGIGGGFISTVSAFPINQIITRIERIRIYKFLYSKLDHMSKSELLKAQDLISKSIEKII